MEELVLLCHCIGYGACYNMLGMACFRMIMCELQYHLSLLYAQYPTHG